MLKNIVFAALACLVGCSTDSPDVTVRLDWRCSGYDPSGFTIYAVLTTGSDAVQSDFYGCSGGSGQLEFQVPPATGAATLEWDYQVPLFGSDTTPTDSNPTQPFSFDIDTTDIDVGTVTLSDVFSL